MNFEEISKEVIHKKIVRFSYDNMINNLNEYLKMGNSLYGNCQSIILKGMKDNAYIFEFIWTNKLEMEKALKEVIMIPTTKYQTNNTLNNFKRYYNETYNINIDMQILNRTYANKYDSFLIMAIYELLNKSSDKEKNKMKIKHTFS